MSSGSTEFIIMPRIVWLTEYGKWSIPKEVRIRLEDLRRYEEYELSSDQKHVTPNQVTKVVYVKYAEQSRDQVMVRTEHMVVDLDLRTMDKLLNVYRFGG